MAELICPTCRNYKGKYECDGCGDDFGLYCGHCARPVYVVFINHVMKQRLCPSCRMSGDNPMENGIYDCRHFNLKELKGYFEIRSNLKNNG